MVQTQVEPLDIGVLAEVKFCKVAIHHAERAQCIV